MEVDTDSDIYDSIPTTDNTELYEEIEKLHQQNNLLQDLIRSLEGDIDKLCEKITEMKKIQDNLAKNISELFKTAKRELERKDRTITELRSQLEGFLQRNKSNFSMKRERDKSPSIGKLSPEHVAKKTRQDDESRMKHSHFRRSRSRSRSMEENRRHRDRRDRFDRHRYDHDSRRVSMRDERYERSYKSKNYEYREYDRRKNINKETEVKNGTGMDRRHMVETNNVEQITEMTKKMKKLDKKEVVVILTDMEESIKLKNVEDTKMSKDSDKKEIVISYVKKSPEMRNNVDSVDKLEEENGKKKMETQSNLEETGIMNRIENEDKSEKEVEENKTAVQSNVNEMTHMKNCNKMEEETNKESNLLKEQKRVTTEKNVCKERGPDQRIVVRTNTTKALIGERDPVVKTQNNFFSNNEESIQPIDLALTNEEKEKSNMEKKNQTPLNKQNEENLTTQKDTGTKVNKTKIEEITKRLSVRLEEESKQDPEKTASVSLQLADCTGVLIEKAEVKKAKIEEVTRRLFGNFEDKEEETSSDLKIIDARENSNKNQAKNVNGVKIEAVSKKLFGKLEEAKQEKKKSFESVTFANLKKVDEKNEEITNTKIENVSKNVLETTEDEMEGKKPKTIAGSSKEITTKETAHKIEDIKQNKIEVTQVLEKSSRSDSVKGVSDKSCDEVINMRIEEVSKQLFEEKEKTPEVENQKVTSVNLTLTTGEEITDNRKNLHTSTIDMTQNLHKILEETEQVTQKRAPRCLNSRNFGEIHDKREDKTEIKIAEMSRKLSKKLFKTSAEETEGEKQKVTSISSTETCVTKTFEEIATNGKKNEVNKTKYDDMDVNLTESLKNSADFTKKRHDMMYGEVSKEISMFIPQYGLTKVLSKSKETTQNNDGPCKKDKREHTKTKVNERHKEKKKASGSSQKSNKEKSQKTDKGKKRSDTITLKHESLKVHKVEEKKNETLPEVLHVHKTLQEKNVSSVQTQNEDNTNNKKQCSKDNKEGNGKNKCEILMKEESSKPNEKNPEVPSNATLQNETSKLNKQDEIKKESSPEVLNDQKTAQERNNLSSVQAQNEDNRSSNKIQSSKDDKEDKGENKCDNLMKDECSKHNKERNSEVPPKILEVEVLKSGSPKKSPLKDPNKSKKTKDTKNKDDDCSGSIVEESDRVLRSATRRNSRLLEETQKKITSDITNQKNKKSDLKLDLNPRFEPSDFISVNLSHDGEIPVLHIDEDSHLDSTNLNFENCAPVVTSSPIKSDLNTSFNSNGLNGSNSLSEAKIFNTSSGRKRRRVILTMID